MNNMATLSSDELEKYTQLMVRVLFPDEYTFSKVIWRMSSGSRSKAISVSRKVLKHYDFIHDVSDEDFEYMFDNACADVNGGVEVEWDSE